LALKTTPEIALNILDGVIDFMNFRHKDKIQSFQRIIDLLGRNCQKSRDKTYLSRVDIELINEQIKLFYSAQDVVEIILMRILLPLLNTFH
jgi:hypothetical protein